MYKRRLVPEGFMPPARHQGAGFHLRTRVEDASRPVIAGREGERAAFWALPFMDAASLEAAIGGIRW